MNLYVQWRQVYDKQVNQESTFVSDGVRAVR